MKTKEIEKLDLNMQVRNIFSDGISVDSVISRLNDLQDKINEIIDAMNKRI